MRDLLILETGSRLIINQHLCWIGLMLFMLWLEDKLHFGGKFNFEHIKTIHLFVLSIPAAAALWLFRNEDKKIDHKNAEEQETRHYNAIKADNIFKLIQIVIGDLTLILKEEIEVKELPSGKIHNQKIQRRKVIAQCMKRDDSTIWKTVEASDLMEFNITLNLLKKYYLILVKYLKEYEELTKDTTLSEHYARQNYFFIGSEVCDGELKKFFLKYGKEAREQDYSLSIYKDFENLE
jgi:hypothetical protein